MELAEGIRKVGFRRWYERQLIESHACLVTGLLGVMLVLGSLESLSFRSEPFTLLFLIVTAGGLATWAVYRYLTILLHAEHAGEHSTCGRCAAYGLLEVTGAQVARAGVGVRCRKCGHEWTIE